LKKRVAVNERVLVTALTKRLAEDLSGFIQQRGIKCTYLHSDIDTLERVGILRDLRLGKFEVLVGINLLREGLDLPEVSLVAILDADKEGFLRSETSLIQTIGRAARHINAKVILYADKVTGSMDRAIRVTERRRQHQKEYNKKHGIKPESIRKAIRQGLELEFKARRLAQEALVVDGKDYDQEELIGIMEKEMLEAADALEFEKAARLRDQIAELKEAPEIGSTRSKRKKKKKTRTVRSKMLKTRVRK